jgi:F-type H+-transporting ATPase subunit gamma
MAGGQERVLRRRIKSVQSTKKITKAMELIAASRIVKAQMRVAAARPYSERITTVIGNLASGGAASSSPLLRQVAPGDVHTVAYVVVTADRGLCGGYNTSVIRTAERAIKADVEAGRQYRLILVGKKGEAYFKFRKYDIAASFQGMSDQPTYENAREVAGVVAEMFNSGDVQKVELVYTKFISAGTQRVQHSQFMPLDPASVVEAAGAAGASGGAAADYEFEPSAGGILDLLLPRYAEARLFASMLDSSASEHAARQRAMKSATDNAQELIVKLSRTMNRARQESITTEIMEIVGGAEALSAAAQPSEG